MIAIVVVHSFKYIVVSQSQCIKRPIPEEQIEDKAGALHKTDSHCNTDFGHIAAEETLNSRSSIVFDCRFKVYFAYCAKRENHVIPHSAVHYIVDLVSGVKQCAKVLFYDPACLPDSLLIPSIKSHL